MKSREMLNRVLTLLYSVKNEEVLFTVAKLKDGTLVESPTFDVGETVEIISEDGTKSLAPDGEHELALKDTEGKETLIKVITKDGKIVERENVELETEEAEELPGSPNKANEIPTPAAAGQEVDDLPTSSMMEEHGDEEEKEEDKPMDMKKHIEEMGKHVEEMAYRIEELEKKMEEMGKHKMEEDKKKEEEEEMEEEELPKLDGAPIEAGKDKKFSLMKANNKTKDAMIVRSSHNRVLDRLYN